jgi:hypothetical protein
MHKKNFVFLAPAVLILFSLVLIFFSLSKGPSSSVSTVKPGNTYQIILTKDGFYPLEITLAPGDQIEFKSELGAFWPASDLHPTHGIYPEFDPKEPIDPDKTWTFQFLKSGRWKFHDHLNPYFRGIIVVK